MCVACAATPFLARSACACAPDRPRLPSIQVEAIMPGTVEKKLGDLGITLSAPAAPVANYVGFVRTGNLLVVSGQLCFDGEGKLVAIGKLGGSVTIEDGQKAARQCAINLLAQIKVALGEIENTASAFTAAIDGGFAIETDLQLSGDGEAMVHHDFALGRLTLGSRQLAAMTAAGLKEVPFKATTDRMMTLGEMCDLVAGR